jgi:hypothetical protein
MEPNHKGTERDKVKTRCLEGVQMIGNNPIKLAVPVP